MIAGPLKTSLCAVAVSLVSAGAFAQSGAPSPAPTHSEYVEVTTSRLPEEPSEVPASLTVIGGDELRDRGATDLRSALTMAAGVDIAPGGDSGPAGSVPEFWGLKEFDAFLLVVDGVPWGGAFNPALTTLNLDNVERIEVLRGAAPVMYGATSFVGVIQVVHREAGAPGGNLSLAGGSYGTGAATLATRLPEWAGFQSSLLVDLDRQGFKDDRTLFRRGHVLWRNSRTLASGVFRFDVDGTLLDQDPASPHVREGATLSGRTPLDANHNPADAFLNDRRLTATAGYDRALKQGSWSTLVSFSHATNDALRGFLDDLDNPDLNARGLRQNIGYTDIYFDTHLAWTKWKTVRAVAGLDHLHGEAESKGAVFDYFAPLDGSSATPVSEPTELDLRTGDRREFSGLYGYVEWNPASAWRLEAGARLNRTQEKREGEEGGAEPAGGDAGAQTRSTVRPGVSLGATWTPWQRDKDALRFYTNYRNTFKPAAIDFGLGEAEGESGILEPETAESFELGAKARVGRARFEANAFQMDFHNLVIAQSIGGLPSLTNAGKERFRGIETSVFVDLPGAWRWRGSYSLHDARFKDFLTEFDGVPTQLADKRLEMSARHMAATGLLYAPARGVTGQLELGYVGSRFLNKRNTAVAPSYTTLNAALGYRKTRWEVRLDGRNLTDRRDAVAESELGDAQYYELPARRFDVTAGLRF